MIRVAAALVVAAMVVALVVLLIIWEKFREQRRSRAQQAQS